MIAEIEGQRQKRHHQRVLFDGIADLYDEYRRAYPDEVVNFMLTTAGLQTGSAVLEVGCGTGQLTEQLALFGFDLTAIDIGPSMIAGARRRIGDREVSLLNVAFEDFERPGVSFDMVVSATAFQWVDPEVKFTKPVARRPDDPRCDNQPPPLPFSARIVHHTAIRAVVASVRAREPGAPGSVKLTKWIPTRISAPLSWPRARCRRPVRVPRG